MFDIKQIVIVVLLLIIIIIIIIIIVCVYFDLMCYAISCRIIIPRPRAREA